MRSAESLGDDDSGFDLNESLLQADEAFLNDVGDVSSAADDAFDAAVSEQCS